MPQGDLRQSLIHRQACELLQVHPGTLINGDKNGALKAVRIGGRRLPRCKNLS